MKTNAAISLASACLACRSSSISLCSAALFVEDGIQDTSACKNNNDKMMEGTDATSDLGTSAQHLFIQPDFCLHRAVCYSKVVPARQPVRLLYMHPTFAGRSLNVGRHASPATRCERGCPMFSELPLHSQDWMMHSACRQRKSDLQMARRSTCAMNDERQVMHNGC